MSNVHSLREAIRWSIPNAVAALGGAVIIKAIASDAPAEEKARESDLGLSLLGMAGVAMCATGRATFDAIGLVAAILGLMGLSSLATSTHPTTYRKTRDYALLAVAGSYVVVRAAS